MIKTENDSLEITQRIHDSNIKWQVFHQLHISHKIPYNTDRFHIPTFEAQSYIVDWQLMVDESFDVEKLLY